MDNAQFVALLTTLQSTDNAARSVAEKTYTDAKASEPSRVLACLASCLSSSTCPDEAARTQSATMLRRAVLSIGPEPSAWSKAEPLVREQVRLALFQALESEPSGQVRKILIACIAAVSNASDESDPWAQLVPNAFALAGSANVIHQEVAMRLIGELFGTAHVAPTILARKQELGAMVTAGLGVASLQAASLGLVVEMVSVLDAASCAALHPVLPLIEAALRSLATSDQSSFEDALQRLVACAMEQPSLFKPRWAEWVDMMLTFASAKGSLDDGCRSLAFEWVSSLVEAKKKAVIKAVPDLTQKALATAFMFLAEADEDEGWAAIDEDEEEDDDGGLHKAGEAKVDFFVDKLGFAQTGKPLLALMQQYGTSAHWEGKLAAAMAIRGAVEYVDNATALDGMTTLLVQLAQDQHMRVRYAALLALGQTCHDQEAEYHQRWHSRLVPLLTQAASDPIDRCAAMAVGALEAVIQDLEEEVLEEHAPKIVPVLVTRLTSSSHKGVLIAVMEALGALAAGLEGSFDGYYEQLMAMLLACVSRADTQSKLRGKAFECISLLGFAVGKDKFAPAARQAMEAMLVTPRVADDFLSDCIRESMQRVCEVLGQEFAVFLPVLLPSMLTSMNLEAAVTPGNDDEDDEDDEITVPTLEGLIKVKTSQVQEILAVVNLLSVFIKETQLGFLEYVKPTVETLSKLLACSDSSMNVTSNIRDAVYPCWAELVGVLSTAVATTGEEARLMAVELVQRFVDKVAADLSAAEDPSDITPMAQGIASVVRNAGAGCLQLAQCQGVCDLAVSEIMKSFQREKALGDANNVGPLVVGGAAPEEDEDEEEDETTKQLAALMGKGEEEEEQESRLGLCAIFGACMKASPQVFVAHSWPTLQALMKEWLGPNAPLGRRLAVRIACDMCQELGESAVEIWPFFMTAVIESINASNVDERNTAAYTVLLASQLPAFGPSHGVAAYLALGTSLQKFKAKKSDEDALRAADNVVAALVQLCLSHPTICPDLNSCWQTVLSKMPLKVDSDEGQKLHRKMFVEVQKSTGGSLGTMARVAQVLGYLCEIYGRSDHCDEDLQKDLASAFAILPQENLAALMGQFTPNQQKKAEKILQDARK